MVKQTVTVRALLALFLALQAATISAEPDSLAAQRIRGHVEFLADDLIEGRGPGTRGFDLAALYVAEQFRTIGLQPAVGGSWYQPVPLVERKPNAVGPARIRVGAGSDLSELAVAAISGEGAQQWTGRAVFVGYGLFSPADGIDDYAGLDVRGKAVVLYDRAPAGLAPAVARRLTERRAEVALAHGAVGMITILGQDERKSATIAEYRTGFAEPFFNWMQSDGQPFRYIPMRFSAVVWPEAAALLFKGAATDFAAIDARAARGDPLRSSPLNPAVTIESNNRWRRYSASNVIGMIPGADPKLSREVVLMTAHLDHLGIDPAVEGEDKIFNGARDNASGVAAMLEVARQLSSAPERPRRSIMFAAVTAEETGLLGSDYLAAHPVAPEASVVALINIDGGVPLHDFTKVEVIGGWHSTIGPLAEVAAAHNRLGIDPDETPNDEFFERTDHFSFARRGIPAIYLFPSTSGDPDAKNSYRRHNHRPSDDLKLPFNWAGGARFARVAAELLRALADAPAAPRWFDDSQVGQRYAKDQAKAARPRPAPSRL